MAKQFRRIFKDQAMKGWKPIARRQLTSHWGRIVRRQLVGGSRREHRRETNGLGEFFASQVFWGWDEAVEDQLYDDWWEE